MKVLIAALILLIIIGLFMGIHGYVITRLASDLNASCDAAEECLRTKDWQGVSRELNNSLKQWKNHKFWASLTVSTGDIDKIESSLRRSIAFSKLQAEPDFIGEFITFRILIDYISQKEGVCLNEIL